MTDRYHRQTILPGFGVAARDRLARAHAMIVGVGALGCPAADLLVRAGVGTVSILDRDRVELTNLQRQTLYDEGDLGAPKAEAAAARLRRVNRAARVHALVEDLTPGNAEAILLPHPRPDVVLDCTDNFRTRYLLNDACVKHGIPLVYGGAVGTRGVQATFMPAGACLRCLFPVMPAPGASPTCDTAGVLAPATAIIGAAQAADAIKVIVDPSALSGTILSFDLWSNERSRVSIRAAKDPSCPACGLGGGCFEFLDARGAPAPVVLCGRDAVQVPGEGGVDLDALHARLTRHGSFRRHGSSLDGTLAEGRGLTVFADGRAIVGGTTDTGEARAVYARYIGG